MARQTRRYERFQDVADPDHPQALLEQRKKARAHTLCLRFLALSPPAEAYDLKLEARRMHPHHHGRNIVALSDIYGPEAVARAMEDALVYEAFSSEESANLLAQRARFTPEASACHLTRRAARLEVRLAQPDLSLYQANPPPEHHDLSAPEVMSERQDTQASTTPLSDLAHPLTSLQLACSADQYAPLATQAAQKQWPHVDSLARLIEGEAHVRHDRAIKSRLRLARFPVLKTCEPFRWDWPTRLPRLQVQHHFRLELIKDKANLILLGGVGRGNPPLATALGYAAGLQGYAVLLASAIDGSNTLAAAKGSGRLKQELKKYTKPARLILDELGYLPIAKAGAALLFQVISLRDEQGAIVMTSNRAFQDWPTIFTHDSTLTAAILDRLLHHAETVIIEGKSFRMKDQSER